MGDNNSSRDALVEIRQAVGKLLANVSSSLRDLFRNLSRRTRLAVLGVAGLVLVLVIVLPIALSGSPSLGIGRDGLQYEWFSYPGQVVVENVTPPIGNTLGPALCLHVNGTIPCPNPATVKPPTGSYNAVCVVTYPGKITYKVWDTSSDGTNISAAAEAVCSDLGDQQDATETGPAS